ncbi:MAG: sensor histidine kinase [Bdellovibrionales bacterium]
MSSGVDRQIDWTNWINHELKTPLNRMESLLMSLDKSPNCGFDEKKIILKIQDSLSECRNTLDSLYLYNKIQLGKIAPKITHKDVNKIVLGAVQDAEVLANAKGVKIMVETEPLFPVPLDEQLFKRAFLNILENAIKFSPHEGKILLSTEDMDGAVVIQIADQGAGMSEKSVKEIFEPYYRVEETAHLPGTGLGLFIAKKFIDFHKGKIEVDSVVGEGSTFTIELPKG